MSFKVPLQVAVTTILLNDYLTVVILIAVAYDYILTFSEEIELIWSKPWSRVSTLFVLIRYFGLCYVIIVTLCMFNTWNLEFAKLTRPNQSKGFINAWPYRGDILIIIGVWAGLIFFTAADLVMILRVWALYGRSRLILATLLVLYAAEVILYVIYCATLTAQNGSIAIAAQILDYSYCARQHISPFWSDMADGVQIVLSALMCLLVAIQFIRQSIEMHKATKQFQLSRYMNILAKQGMIYFLAVLTYAVITITVATLPTDQWWKILIVAMQSVPVVTLVPRFVLSLRELYARDLRSRCGSQIDSEFGFMPFSCPQDEGVEGSGQSEGARTEEQWEMDSSRGATDHESV